MAYRCKASNDTLGSTTRRKYRIFRRDEVRIKEDDLLGLFVNQTGPIGLNQEL